MTLTLDQKRARHALAQVQEVVGEAYASNYRSYVRSLPMNIRQNGLGQAIALQMAGCSASNEIGEGHQALLKHVLAWLCDKKDGYEHTPYPLEKGRRTGEELLKAIMEEDESLMLEAQYELMAWLKWLKTFAEALIEPEDEAANSTEEGADT